ncbi:MAG: hypothetical protein FWC55_03430 [Firmicutes bacterium]|nr:hypothetical protein [Bacillota bacterium]
MSAIQRDKTILRELAGKYAEIAADDRNRERKERARNINSLRPARPLVWLHELPWHEIDIDGALACRCESAEAREAETSLRRTLYRWKYIQADMVVDPAFCIRKEFKDPGMGVNEHSMALRFDKDNEIVSRRFCDQLETEEQADRLRLPELIAYPELDARRADFAREMFGDILPVRLTGHAFLNGPWDNIAVLRGVEPILYDLYDRPEHLHRIRKFYMEAGLAMMEQMERLGLLDCEPETLHMTPPYVDELPAADYAGGPFRLKDIWFFGTAQMFSAVSPAVFDEFELRYMRPLMEKCGLVYYGCCEPLDNKIELLKTAPNLRKLGVTAWANLRVCAEQIGPDYVMARKPNPALLGGSFDEDAVRAETAGSCEAALAYGCPCEFVLNNVSTVSYRPENLIRWVDVLEETIGRYYG